MSDHATHGRAFACCDTCGVIRFLHEPPSGSKYYGPCRLTWDGQHCQGTMVIKGTLWFDPTHNGRLYGP